MTGRNEPRKISYGEASAFYFKSLKEGPYLCFEVLRDAGCSDRDILAVVIQDVNLYGTGEASLSPFHSPPEAA